MSRLFVNRLTVIDCSFLDAERGLVGESWQVDLELAGTLDAQGMVLDFGEVKKTVKQLIDEHFDHKLLVPARYQPLQVRREGGRSEILFPMDTSRRIEHQSPDSAIALVDAERIDQASLEPAIVALLRTRLPENIEHINLRLWPEEIEGAFYHYSHGLKHHGGNCQRIAHGHRSRLQIRLDGVRKPAVEMAWAARWRDIYIGTRADLHDSKAAGLSRHSCFHYRSQQGEFWLTLPAAACYLIDTDSTVENIAQHIAERIKQEYPGHAVEVHAFEGVDKGAIGAA